MSLNIHSQGFSQARLPMNLSERSLLSGSGATKASSLPAPLQALAAKPAPRFRTLTQPAAAPAPKPTSVAVTRNPYQARSARSSEDFAIVADSTPDVGPLLPAHVNAVSSPHPMADRIKDIQNMATKLGYVELSEGAITKAIQNRSSLLANYVV